MSERVIVEQQVVEPVAVRDKIAAGGFLWLVGSVLVGAIIGLCLRDKGEFRTVGDFAAAGFMVAISILMAALILGMTIFAIGVVLA